MKAVSRVVRLVAALFMVGCFTSIVEVEGASVGNVTYDSRSLIINGKRELIFSGSIHYPRSPQASWPALLAKSKQGGLNAISTYVFWNLHEPTPGKFNFGGEHDLVKFIKLIQKNGMYAILRIGPFVQAEWTFGGFPFWLQEIDDIVFRTNNKPFQYYMERFVRKVVEVMKKEELFASQGGPIILAQVENEYNLVGEHFGANGTAYINWAANMAVSTDTGVPWMMCKQKNAPSSVISTCNGRDCGDSFVREDPTKPILWTENWTAQYRVFGDPPSQRSAESLAYSVVRFFSKMGTLTNYYMYHGGTNFDRKGAAFVMTRYYDEAPLDEYGLLKEPKWGHLRDMHHALRLCRKGLLWGTPSREQFGKGIEAWIYEKSDEKVCVAFLTNAQRRDDTTVNFRGSNYFLPRHSISILPDCKNVGFNTQSVNAQHNSRTYQIAKQTHQKNTWKMYEEPIVKYRQTSLKTQKTQEFFKLTKDKTDYAWYYTSFRIDDEDLPRRHDIRPVLQIGSLGHVVHVFVNKRYIGTGHSDKMEPRFQFTESMDLKPGTNHISILAATVGLPDSGPLLEHKVTGVTTVAIQGLNTGTLDLSANGWGHEVALVGEKTEIYNEGAKIQWTNAKSGQPVTWYKRYFDEPDGSNPVALDMSSMSKGLMWVNGHCLGRYWVSYLSSLGQPSQSVYHVPRAFLKPKDNLLVIFEEHKGKPEEILIITARRDNICTFVSEYHPAHGKLWTRQGGNVKNMAEDIQPHASLKCLGKKFITKIVFASFGNPTGICGNFTAGTCHSPHALSLVEKLCLGKRSCSLPMTSKDYAADANCPDTTNTLAVQVKCSRRKAHRKPQ